VVPDRDDDIVPEMSMNSASSIARFWSWFTTRADQFEQWQSENSTHPLAGEMQPAVQRLGSGIGWEIGPGHSRPNFLAFTLNGDLGNVQLAQEIIKAAPKIPGWEFRVGRPARPYSDRMVFYCSQGQTLEVELQTWRYVLTAFDRGKFFDIAITSKQSLPIDQKLRDQILLTALQGAIGEFGVLQWIDRIQFEEFPDEQWEERATPFRHLADHLANLTGASW